MTEIPPNKSTSDAKLVGYLLLSLALIWLSITLKTALIFVVTAVLVALYLLDWYKPILKAIKACFKWLEY